MRAGRPLRFLGAVLGGWTLLRVGVLWPTIDGVPALIRAVAPPLAAATRPLPAVALARPGRPSAMRTHRLLRAAAAPVAPPSDRAGDPGAGAVALALASLVRFGEAVPIDRPAGQAAPSIPPPLRPAPPAVAGSRLAGSAWLLARGGAGGTLTGGRLGGSQAGARLTYALGEARRIALLAHVATPLAGRGREAGFGVEWRPTDAPVRLIVEQRVALDGGRGGPTLMAIGGIGPREVAAGFRLEAYGEAGAIKRDRVEGFADAAARLTRPVATVGRALVDLGAGSWGAAQRGAGRLDIGPTLGVQVPVAGRSVRLTADWRQRVAGAASPGSGLALSLGTDF